MSGITLIILSLIIGCFVEEIFEYKHKKDMFIEYLKHYEDGTLVSSDKVIKKSFEIDFEDCDLK